MPLLNTASISFERLFYIGNYLLTMIQSKRWVSPPPTQNSTINCYSQLASFVMPVQSIQMSESGGIPSTQLFWTRMRFR